MLIRFCSVCGHVVPNDRAIKGIKRGGAYCKDECAKKDKNERRQMRSVKECRLCGRKYRAKKQTERGSEEVPTGADSNLSRESAPSILDHVREAHTNIVEIG